jgi:Fe-S cluster biogenesis protein NfuA
MTGDPIIEEVKEEIPIELSEEDKEITTQIEDLLETRVRPSVASHGGDIVFHNYSEGIVELEMRGACSGCPSSMATLKMGVENMLKHYIPEIIEVREV